MEALWWFISSADIRLACGVAILRLRSCEHRYMSPGRPTEAANMSGSSATAMRDIFIKSERALCVVNSYLFMGSFIHADVTCESVSLDPTKRYYVKISVPSTSTLR